MDNPLLLMILILAIAVMGGYYYLKRAKHQEATHAPSLPDDHKDSAK